MRPSFVMSGVATGLRRNLSMTVALILNTAIALAFAGGALLVHKEIGDFKQQYEGKLNVSIYLCGTVRTPNSPCKAAVSEAQKNALQTKLNADPRVKGPVDYWDENKTYAEGKKTLDAQDAQFLKVGTLPAMFIVKLNDISKDYSAIQKAYATQPGVDVVQNQSDSLKTLLTIFDKARTGAIVVAIAIMICALILMANAIQVAATQRRHETGIMRLVGASRWMTQLPFMIEAVISAVIGGILAVVLDWIGKKAILDGIFHQQVEHNVLPSLSTNDVLVYGGVGALAGIVLSAITAYVTLRVLVRL